MPLSCGTLASGFCDTLVKASTILAHDVRLVSVLMRFYWVKVRVPTRGAFLGEYMDEKHCATAIVAAAPTSADQRKSILQVFGG